MLDLVKFFEEKKIPYKNWVIEHKGETHYIDSDVVIEAILGTQGTERCKIAGTLFALDFKNACIPDYLEHLARCLIIERGI